MKKVFTFLFAALIAAALCTPSSALDRSGNPPAGGPGESQEKTPVRKAKKKAPAKKKGNTVKKAKKGAGKAVAAKKAAPATPPPGTGYGNIDPEPSAALPPARR